MRDKSAARCDLKTNPGSVHSAPRQTFDMKKENPTIRGQGVSSGNDGAAAQEKRELRSQDIFGDANAVTITHDGATYILRITKQNKLILTK